MTSFLGVAFGVIGDRVACIATSDGVSLTDTRGLRTSEVIAFLWTLSAQREARAVVGFDTATDLELAFRDLSKDDKDVLFGLRQKAEASKVDKDSPLYDIEAALRPGVISYNPKEYKPRTRQAAKLRARHGADGPERGEQASARYRLSILPGKFLRIANAHASGFSFYDINSYFEGCDLVDALAYLPLEDRPNIERIEKNDLPLWTGEVADQLSARCVTQAQAVALLAERIKDVIAPLDLNPKQWYGPSAIASRCLNKWGARRQARRLNEKNSVNELLKAIDCAYFGGRVEMIKSGTVKDVRVYDLNSAYAYATCLLSQFYKPLRFTRDYQTNASAPFSVWLVDYAIPEDVTIGPLPTRHPRGGISFRSRGRGYFWQPEVDYMRQRYPDCFTVKWGYVCEEYKPVTFAGDIQQMYDYRQVLKAKGDKGEKIIKLALSNLYGKFAQNSGTAYYQSRAWAGWITSFIRRLLLEAVTGIEASVVCFAQDAIHLSGLPANIHEDCLGDGLGQYKLSQHAQGLYLSPGIYELRDQCEPVKSASRGSNQELDYVRIATELSDRQCSELSRAFFVGWQLARQAPLKYAAAYLNEISESLALVPSRLKARNYSSEFDWNKESRDSKINRSWSGLLSARYIPQDTTPTLRLQLKDRGWS